MLTHCKLIDNYDNYFVLFSSWYDPLGYGGSLGRRRPTNRTNSLKGGSLMSGGGRGGPLVGTQNIHRKLGPASSYHSSIVR